MFNTEKEDIANSSSKDVFLPPIHMSNENNLDVGQKRTVPWLEDDNRDTKTARTQEKEIGKILYFRDERKIVILRFLFF